MVSQLRSLVCGPVQTIRTICPECTHPVYMYISVQGELYQAFSLLLCLITTITNWDKLFFSKLYYSISSAVAFFPGRSHLRFLITCSIQNGGVRLGKFSQEDRQRVDRRGAVPNHCNPQTCLDRPQVYRITSCIDTVFKHYSLKFLDKILQER